MLIPAISPNINLLIFVLIYSVFLCRIASIKHGITPNTRQISKYAYTGKYTKSK